MSTRDALGPVRLMLFAEVAYWAAAGLLATPSREAVEDDGPLREATDRLSRRFVEILAENGVPYDQFLAMFLARFPAAASLATGIRVGQFVNFVLRCGWMAGSRAPDPGDVADDAGRLFALLCRQDFSVEERLAARLRAPGGVFVQVGANDLATVDDRPYRLIYSSQAWRKVLVEPTNAAFRAMVAATETFAATTLVRAAVDERSGTRRIASSSVTAETRQATFSTDLARTRDVLNRTETVRCLDGPGLAREAGIEAIDVLVVDTEGHDRVVVDEILRVAEPGAIVVEWAHAGVAEAVRLLETFEARGYDFCWPPISLDFVAVKRGSQGRAGGGS